MRCRGCAVRYADFDWFEGMDPLNVKQFEWALAGEEILAREFEREAAEMLERVAADPSNVLGEIGSSPRATGPSWVSRSGTRSCDR
jgi:hypothetical protein